MCQDGTCGIELWEYGGLAWTPHIGPTGQCRVAVIDLENRRVLREARYHGVMDPGQMLLQGEVEVTWAEAGGLLLIGAGVASAATLRWRWSHHNAAWEEGGCPPDQILEAILTAMGKRP